MVAKLPSPNNRGLVLKEGNIIRKTYTSRRGSGQELNEFEVFFSFPNKMPLYIVLVLVLHQYPYRSQSKFALSKLEEKIIDKSPTIVLPKSRSIALFSHFISNKNSLLKCQC